jgi:hypothetical protein
MTVVPTTGNKRPLTVNIPVTKKDDGTVEAPEAVKSLGGQLRVSDEVQLTYVRSGTGLKYSDASAKGGGDPKRDEATVFTFVGSRTVPRDGKQVEAITVRQGATTLTFLVPDADPKDKAYQPDAELLKKIKEVQRGNTVRLTYDLADFAFWLRDIEITKPADVKKAPDASAAAGKTVQTKDAPSPVAKP